MSYGYIDTGIKPENNKVIAKYLEISDKLSPSLCMDCPQANWTVRYLTKDIEYYDIRGCHCLMCYCKLQRIFIRSAIDACDEYNAISCKRIRNEPELYNVECDDKQNDKWDDSDECVPFEIMNKILNK